MRHLDLGRVEELRDGVALRKFADFLRCADSSAPALEAVRALDMRALPIQERFKPLDHLGRFSAYRAIWLAHDLDRLCLGLARALFKRAEQLLKRDNAGVWDSVVGELAEPAVANAGLLGDQLPIAALLLKLGLNDGLNLWLHDSLSQSFANASSNILRSV